MKQSGGVSASKRTSRQAEVSFTSSLDYDSEEELRKQSKNSKIGQRRSDKQGKKAVEKGIRATKNDVKAPEALNGGTKRGRKEVPVEKYIKESQEKLDKM